jgi:hypothetical protein
MTNMRRICDYSEGRIPYSDVIQLIRVFSSFATINEDCVPNGGAGGFFTRLLERPIDVFISKRPQLPLRCTPNYIEEILVIWMANFFSRCVRFVLLPSERHQLIGASLDLLQHLLVVSSIQAEFCVIEDLSPTSFCPQRLDK